MKLSKLLLTSTTALGLSLTAAMADDNETYLDQNGNDNDALIEQTGSNANAGSDGSGNSPGDMVQNGNENEIDIFGRMAENACEKLAFSVRHITYVA